MCLSSGGRGPWGDGVTGGSGLFSPVASALASRTPEQTSTRLSSSALSLWFNQGEGIWGMFAFLLLIIPLVRKWQERGRLITESLFHNYSGNQGLPGDTANPLQNSCPGGARKGQGLLRRVQSNRAKVSRPGPPGATAIPLHTGEGPWASASPHPILHLFTSPLTPKPFFTPRHLLHGLAADRYELCALWFLMRSANGSTSTSSGGLFPSSSPLHWASGRGAILETYGTVPVSWL